MSGPDLIWSNHWYEERYRKRDSPVLLWLSCYVLPIQSCPDRPLLAVLSWLTCSGCIVLTKLSYWLPNARFHILTFDLPFVLYSRIYSLICSGLRTWILFAARSRIYSFDNFEKLGLRLAERLARLTAKRQSWVRIRSRPPPETIIK